MSNLENSQIKLAHLKEGMVLAYNLIDVSGTILLKRGATLNQDILADLATKGEVFYYQKQGSLSIKQGGKQAFLAEGANLYKEIFLDVREKKVLTIAQVQNILSFVNRVHSRIDKLPTLGFQDLLNDNKDEQDWLFNHSVNVFFLTMLFAIVLNLNKNQILLFSLGGFLHDIGHAHSDESKLFSKEVLSNEDLLGLKAHPHIGYSLTKDLKIPTEVKQAILFHHERFNGQGYPTTLPYTQLPMSAKVVGIADVFESLSMYRPYKNVERDIEGALLKLLNMSNKSFTPELTNKFIEHLGPVLNANKLFYTTGQIIQTNFGEVARITEVNYKHWSKPKIEIIMTKEGKIYRKPMLVDMNQDSQRLITKLFAVNKTDAILAEIKKKELLKKFS